MIYHYTYIIKNILTGKKYVGVRTSRNLEPKKDLGILYFSSSTDQDFLSEQSVFPRRFRYRVIKSFATRLEAMAHEIYLHSLKNVGLNDNYINRVNANKNGYDAYGLKWTEEQKSKRSGSGNPMFGRIGPNLGKGFDIEFKDKLYKAEELSKLLNISPITIRNWAAKGKNGLIKKGTSGLEGRDGHKQTEVSKTKIKEASLKMHQNRSLEDKKKINSKISMAQKGRPKIPNHCCLRCKKEISTIWNLNQHLKKYETLKVRISS